MKHTPAKSLFFILLMSLSGLFYACSPEGGIHFRRVSCFQEMIGSHDACENNRPRLLYLTHGGNPVGERLESDVFTDPDIAAFTADHIDGFRGDTLQGDWRSFLADYGIASLPVMMLFSPDGQLLLDISHLGFIGRDENGELLCRKGVLRPMKLAVKMLAEDDSVFFSQPNWHEVELANIRLDSKLFERLVSHRVQLEALYGNDYHIAVDYALAQAAVNLVTSRDTVAECLPHRREAFYRAIDLMTAAGFPVDEGYCCTERYRFYGDINIALGLGDLTTARRRTEEALAARLISPQEYHQLLAQIAALP